MSQQRLWQGGGGG
ncbi:succinylglutamic semialdehyde dehydrogenase, partial [Yersinia pestis PY-16]